MTNVQRLLEQLSEQCATLQYRADEALRCRLFEAQDDSLISQGVHELLATVDQLQDLGAIKHPAPLRMAPRPPWLRVMQVLADEINTQAYPYPYAIRRDRTHGPCLFLRTSHVMQHLAHSMPLREFWSCLPIKSDRVLRRQLNQAGVIALPHAEKSINGQRLTHLLGLSIDALKRHGIELAMPADARDAVLRSGAESESSKHSGSHARESVAFLRPRLS